MPAIVSSPVAYPPSSSPPKVKRSLPLFTRRKPDDKLDAKNAEEDTEHSEPLAKRRMLNKARSDVLHGLPEVNEGNASQQPARHYGGFVDFNSDDEDAQVSQLPIVRPEVDATSVNQDLFYPKTTPSVLESSRSLLFSHFTDRREVRNCAGRITYTRSRSKAVPVAFEQLAAERSTTKAGRAKKSFYGIDVQDLLKEAKKETTAENVKRAKSAPIEPETALPSIETPATRHKKKSLLWTEKYRAKRFFDLIGDDRTHREVLRWLKAWDTIVFPRAGKSKPAISRRPDELDEKPHRKILMLTGPPGLGKTTLAHVCASQAGYEIMEINASDDRSATVVKGRIKTSVGTESVKNVGASSKSGPAKSARPMAVIIDEVDGVVTGSGASGEGGFIKALMDLVQLDAKNSADVTSSTAYSKKTKKQGDSFRLLRPIILICNDVYHPSLRPLRQSSFAEVVHVRKPPIDAVAARMQSIFEKEGILADKDGVRKLCEATWGTSSGSEAKLDTSGTGEGDIRSVLVVGEWAAGKLKSSSVSSPRLTKRWVEQNMLGSLQHGGGGARGVGRGGTKEVVSRVFVTGAGFPKPVVATTDSKSKASLMTDKGAPRAQLHANEIAKKAGMDRLREMVDTSGETDRIMTELFATYPSQQFNDDSLLSKPHSAYEWLHFSDLLSKKVYSDQDWELSPYLSQPILAYHNLFASPARHSNYSDTNMQKKRWGDDDEKEDVVPFSGPRADYDAKEAEKSSRAVLLELQSSLNPCLLRSFRSPEDIASDLLPYLTKLLDPDVKPVVIGGGGDARGVASVRKAGEKEMVRRAVDVMGGVGVRFERGRLEAEFGERDVKWVYRMEPPLDELSQYLTAPTEKGSNPAQPQRYAIRQVLDQEYQKAIVVRQNATRQARFAAGDPDDDTIYNFSSSLKDLERGRSRKVDLEDDGVVDSVKRDFFGRVLDGDDEVTVGGAGTKSVDKGKKMNKKVWVTFHEGFSNAVRKPVSVEELMRGL